MADPAIDVTFAYLQLGVPPGASMDDVQTVLANAKIYKFATRERIDTVQRLVDFFFARLRLGAEGTPFADIRKAYHKKAMALHPDRNAGNTQTEDQLKALNTAFSLIEDIYREARDYFHLSDTYRRETEEEARQTTLREKPAGTRQQPPHRNQPETQPHTPIAGKKFMAASVPRSIRNARLSHVPIGYIIGSWHIEVKSGFNQVFDVIMLPELEFTRMRLHLSVANVSNPALERGGLSPPYILKDTKEIVVPEGTPNAYEFAKAHFEQQFKLPQRN